MQLSLDGWVNYKWEDCRICYARGKSAGLQRFQSCLQCFESNLHSHSVCKVYISAVFPVMFWVKPAIFESDTQCFLFIGNIMSQICNDFSQIYSVLSHTCNILNQVWIANGLNLLYFDFAISRQTCDIYIHIL